MGTTHSIRYDVLDSWRGIAALFVALYHFRIHSNISTSSLIDGSYLFVDFFFALSGFVIAANYKDRLSDTASVRRFVVLRFGRLYPLHFFMLAAYVSLETFAVLIPAAGELSHDGVFASERNSPFAIITNLLLIHSLGIHESATWNLPSWTISVEFYTYIVFAALICLVRRKFIIVTVCIITTSIILIVAVSDKMDVSYDYGIFRCLAGFFAGCICYEIFVRTRELVHARVGLIAGTMAEVFTILWIFGFIAVFAQARWSIAAPVLFGAAVFVFAFEKGLISEVLKHRWFLSMGAMSYSIYMTHQFVQARIFNICDLLAGYSDNPIVASIRYRAGELSESERIHGDIAYVPMLLAVVALSYLTYRFVEIPFRGRFRRLADRMDAGASRRLEWSGSGLAGPGPAIQAGQLWLAPQGLAAATASVEPIAASFTAGREAVDCKADVAAPSHRSASHAGATRRACPPAATAASAPEVYLQEAYCDASELLNPFTPRKGMGGVSRSMALHAKRCSQEHEDD